MFLMTFPFFEIIKFSILVVPVLVSVACLTLTERKVLGYTQTIKGPNLVGTYGLLQSLAVGVKLFSKELIVPNHVSLFLFFFCPCSSANSKCSNLICFAISSILGCKWYFLRSTTNICTFFSWSICYINIRVVE